jgi:hypothetical protein
MPEADFIPFLSNPSERYPDLALGAKPEPKLSDVSLTLCDLAIFCDVPSVKRIRHSHGLGVFRYLITYA